MTVSTDFFASAVIVAGGSGSRMGRPKQLLPVGGKPVVVRSIEAFQKCPHVREIVVVTPEENREVVLRYVQGVRFANPGQTRLESVKTGCLA